MLKRNSSLFALSYFEVDIQPNSLSSVTITMDTSTVSTLAIYTFSFYLSNPLAVKSKIVIILPSQLSIPSNTCSNYALTFTTVSSLNSSSVCTVTSLRTITLSSININALASGEQVKVTLGSILNS
jgi:hypothetical protein